MTTPSHPDWGAIKALFDATVDLPASARDLLIHAAQLDPAALAELRSLLAHHDDAITAQVFMRQSAALALVDSAAVLQRFAQERQALARLSHPPHRPPAGRWRQRRWPALFCAGVCGQPAD